MHRFGGGFLAARCLSGPVPIFWQHVQSVVHRDRSSGDRRAGRISPPRWTPRWAGMCGRCPMMTWPSRWSGWRRWRPGRPNSVCGWSARPTPGIWPAAWAPHPPPRGCGTVCGCGRPKPGRGWSWRTGATRPQRNRSTGPPTLPRDRVGRGRCRPPPRRWPRARSRPNTPRWWRTPWPPCRPAWMRSRCRPPSVNWPTGPASTTRPR